MADNHATNTEENREENRVAMRGEPLSYRLVLLAIISVSSIFIFVMIVFGLKGVLNEDAQIVAALASAFGIIGTLVGTYFGIKSTNDAKDTVDNVHKETAGTVTRAGNAAQKAASAAQSTSQHAEKAASAAQQATDVAQQLSDTARRQTDEGASKSPRREGYSFIPPPS
jgi:hypothetical protein